MSQRLHSSAVLAASLSLCLLACSGKSDDGGAGGTSGASSSGASAGTEATGGKVQSSATTSSGGSSSGGMSSGAGVGSSGGAAGSSGMSSSSGGSSAVGGTTSSGGKSIAGGTSATGGTSGGGGTKGGTTGTTGTGGKTASGGSSSAAGSVGGATSPGGSAGNGGTGGTVSVECTDVSTTPKNFTKQYEDGSLAVSGSTKTYWTMTNWWHKFGGQTVSLNGLSMKIGNTQNASVPASDGNPMGFPSIFIGTYQTKATVGSNLPKKVSDIKSVPTVFQTNASSLDTKNLNATYDVWFTATSAPLSGARANNPGAGGAYLMVWMFKPEERQPRGGVGGATGASPNFPATTVEGVAGKWDVWVDDKSDPLCISYVASEPIDGLAFDLNKFIQDSVSKEYGITSSMYLSLIFGGFEVWSGGDGLELKQFCAAVN